MSFKVSVLTPSKILAKSLEADSLLLPTTQGVINILKDHTHLIGKLQPGLLTCFVGSKKENFVVTSGVCKIMGDEVVVMTTVGEQSQEIDVERAEDALKRAKERLAKTDNLSDEQILKFQRKLQRAELRIEASKG